MMSEIGSERTRAAIAMIPELKGLGGPASFQEKMMLGLKKQGYEGHFDLNNPEVRSLLVIGGTKHLAEIWKAKRKGVRVVQRLNGMNWIHRKKKTGLRHYLRSEYGNFLLGTIRNQLADAIIYQSQFARSWWQTAYGIQTINSSVIYNGVDLVEYSPQGESNLPEDCTRILLVEGHLGQGNETGLWNAIKLVEAIQGKTGKAVELMVAGKVPQEIMAQAQSSSSVQINWAGVVKRKQIPVLDRSAHLLFSADLNAACPNAVIEALACGLPAVAFATGSLTEILQNDAGKTVPYGSNYWELEAPEIDPLADAAIEILNNLDYFRMKARQQAENNFGLDAMVTGYLKVLLPD